MFYGAIPSNNSTGYEPRNRFCFNGYESKYELKEVKYFDLHISQKFYESQFSACPENILCLNVETYKGGSVFQCLPSESKPTLKITISIKEN